MNIGREGGFPLCAETLSVLNENSEMLNSFLQALPGMARTAILFGDYLFVSDARSHTHRIIKVGSVETGDFENCKLVISTSTHSVHDSSDNEIPDVWKTETADIVAAAQGEAKWRILRFEDVFETRLWNNCIDEFEAGLASSTITNGYFREIPTLYGGGNILRCNTSRTQMSLAVAYKVAVSVSDSHDMVLSIPFNAPVPVPVRLDADVQVVSTGYHYPIRAYVNDNMLKVDIGRYLTDEGVRDTQASGHSTITCNHIVRINKEVIL